MLVSPAQVMNDFAQKHYTSITFLPFSRFWMPLLGSFVAKNFNPFGILPINSVSKICKDIPIIIIHNIGDINVPINGARQFYCALKQNGHENVYLIEVDAGNRHLFTLTDKKQEVIEDEFNFLEIYNLKEVEDIHRIKKINAIQAIYAKYGLPVDPSFFKDGTDLTVYQPSIKDVKQRIAKSVKNSEKIKKVIDLSAVLIASGLLVYKLLSRPC